MTRTSGGSAPPPFPALLLACLPRVHEGAAVLIRGGLAVLAPPPEGWPVEAVELEVVDGESAQPVGHVTAPAWRAP